MSSRGLDNQRLLERIREHHAASDGVIGMPRMHEVLTDEGETVSPDRIARLMARNGLYGIPQRRRWRRKSSGIRPAFVRNHLERDFSASEPNTKWVIDITYISTAEGFFGLIKRERINRRSYLTLADARSDVFDYIERFHNPRIQRRLDALDRRFSALPQLSAKTG